MSAEVNAEPCHLLMTTDAVGGVWSYALDLARGLIEQNVFVTLAVLGPAPTDAQKREARSITGLELVETALPLDWLSDNETMVEKSAKDLAKMAREIGANLVQLNGSPLASAARFSVPVVAVHHSCLATWWAAVKGEPVRPDWRWRADLVGRHLAASDRLVVPSAAFGASVVASYGLSERPRVVHNGRSKSASLTRADGAGEALLFTAGRLWDEGKDICTLDRAAARLEVSVLAAGPIQGPNSARVECRNLRLLGGLSSEEVRARLAEGPIFVSTSVYEPFGLSVLEAAQAGCALLLSDIPTFRELWHGAALFVPPRDDRSLAQAAERLLREPALRSGLGEAARQRAESFSLARMVRAMASLYAELIQKNQRRPSRASVLRKDCGKITQVAGAAA